MSKVKGIWQGLVTVELEFGEDDIIYPLNELNRRLKEMFTDQVKETLRLSPCMPSEGVISISNIEIQDFVEENE